MSTKESRLKESCLARAGVRRDSGVPAEAHAFRRRGTREDARGKTPRTEAPRGRVRGRVPDDAPREPVRTPRHTARRTRTAVTAERAGELSPARLLLLRHAAKSPRETD